MSDEEYEEASPETKKQIASFFMMSAPPGEVREVLADCLKLVGDPNILSSNYVNKVLSNYNTENMVFGKDPDGKSLMCAPAGKMSEDNFVDPASGRVLTFDHKTNTFTSVTSETVDLPGNVKSYRDAIDKALQTYNDKHYKKEKCVTAVFGNESGELTICVSAQNTKLSAFWTGGWKSYYTLDVSGKGKKTMKGNIKVVVHYFEDGNVQLHTNMDQSADIEVGDEQSTADAVVKAISKAETSFQSELENMYVKMHQSTFKAMRRFLPMNKQNMNWNTAAHSIQSTN